MVDKTNQHSTPMAITELAGPTSLPDEVGSLAPKGAQPRALTFIDFVVAEYASAIGPHLQFIPADSVEDTEQYLKELPERTQVLLVLMGAYEENYWVEDPISYQELMGIIACKVCGVFDPKLRDDNLPAEFVHVAYAIWDDYVFARNVLLNCIDRRADKMRDLPF